MGGYNLPSIDELLKKYNTLNKELEDEKENLIYYLEHAQLEDINILNIHFKIKELMNRRTDIKNTFLKISKD